MTVELRPVGTKCNLSCLYCYQDPMRDACDLGSVCDLDMLKRSAEKHRESFVLFGGEPLLMPEEQLKDIWSFGFEKYGKNGIQTNGVLISNNHIRLFKRYKVSVGVSMDGPDMCNDARRAGSLKETRQATSRTQIAIERLCEEGLSVSLIVNLHRWNTMNDRMPLMHEWFRYLDCLGLQSVRLHVLQVNNEAVRDKLMLSPHENFEAFLSLMELEKELKCLRFDVTRDIWNMLRGRDGSTTCIWRGCDPYTTRSVMDIQEDGGCGNCGRTNKDGVAFLKGEVEGFERCVSLYHTPQECGGCKGCHFFVVCRGQCPGTAIDFDWRNRSVYCETWRGLFSHVENQMLQKGETPITCHPNIKDIEKGLLASWTEGRRPSIETIMKELNRGQARKATDCHGDHTDHGDSHARDRKSCGIVAGRCSRPHGDHVDVVRPIHGNHMDHGDYN